MMYVFQRKLNLRAGGEVKIEIDFPVYEREGRDFSCSYRIDGLSKSIRKSAIGIDPIQAFVMAISLVDVELSISSESKNGDLTWLGGSDLGFRLQS